MADQAAMPLPGRRLGRYEVLHELGRGGMGVVFKANDPAIGRHVAIKTMRLDLWAEGGEQGEAATRFAREAQAIGRLTHPNIVTLYDAQREGDLAYMVMECVYGESLASMLRSGARFSADQVSAIGGQVCDALEHAHAQGVVHRDIKPANLLLQGNGQVKITEFGIASLSTSTLTRSGHAVGTPGYMSPEQIEGRPVDGRSDLFSLGAVLYELACNEKAFPGETVSNVFYRILHTDPIPLHQLNRLSPPALDAAIRKALAKDPDARYARAGEFREALSRLAAHGKGHPSKPAPPPAVPEPAAVSPPPSASGSRKLLIAGALAVAAIGLAAVLWASRSAAPPPAPVRGPPAGAAPSAPTAPGPSPPGPAAPAGGAAAVPAPTPGEGAVQAPKAMRVAFARDVKGVLPVGEGDTFYRDDGKVVLWVRWANVRGKHAVLARWFDPDGTLAHAAPAPEPFDSPADWWTTWTALDLGRVPRARPGRWRVEVRLDDHVMATAHFALLDQPRPPGPAPAAPDIR